MLRGSQGHTQRPYRDIHIGSFIHALNPQQHQLAGMRIVPQMIPAPTDLLTDGWHSQVRPQVSWGRDEKVQLLPILTCDP